MSTTFVEIVNIDYVKPHPNADKLDIAIIKGATVVVQKGTFVRDQHVIYFPPDILIPESVGERLGVRKYLKFADYDGQRMQCRVAACRLRNQPSFGFIAPLETAWGPTHRETYFLGMNVSDVFQAKKYEPPTKVYAGDASPEDMRFHQYTHIEHFWRHHEAIHEGMMVRITEKLHGMNSRVGLVHVGDGKYEFMAGSHKVRRKAPEEGKTSFFWRPLDRPGMRELLQDLSDGEHSVVIFGELFGAGIQDMDYGTKDDYRVFDISVDGRYLDYDVLLKYCNKHGVETVPLLYYGPFSRDLIEEYTYGPTTMAPPEDIQAAFKDREGCIITPLSEQYYAPTGGRLVLKSVSADYLDRKGAQDNG